MNDALGDRMKSFEKAESARLLLPLLPTIARVDGRSFSQFTKGLDRPYDKRMSDLMIETAKEVAKETNAIVAYTQSDEISFAYYSDDYKSQIFCNGRICKMTSLIASLTTLTFNKLLNKYLPENYQNKNPMFDCRVFNLPNLTEAANCFIWREIDATKNAISMAARKYYPHKALMNKNGKQMQEMLFAKGINFNDYPNFFKRGTYIIKKTSLTKFTCDELEKLPPKHEAKTNPDLLIARSKYETQDLPPLTKIVNKIETLFQNQNPIVKDKK